MSGALIPVPPLLEWRDILFGRSKSTERKGPQSGAGNRAADRIGG